MVNPEELRAIDEALAGHGDEAESPESRIAAARALCERIERLDAPPAVLEPRLGRGLLRLSGELSRNARYEESLAQSARALPLVRRWFPPDETANVLLETGWSHLRTGNFPGALEAYREAVRITEGMKDPDFEARALNSLAILLLEMEDYSGASDAGRRAVEFAREAGTSMTEASALNSLATALMRGGDPDGAERCIRESIEALNRTGPHPREHAYQLATWTEVLLARNDHAGARRKIEESWSLVRQIGDAFGLTLVGMYRGRVLLAQGERDEGLRALRDSLAQAVGHDMSTVVLECHLYLYEAHRAAGEIELALEHHEAYHQANKKIYSEQADRRLRALQAQHDVETARQQAEIQRLRTEELERLVSELERANERIREMSIRDGLTGVYNRRYLDAHLETVFQQASRYFRPFSVAIFDVDDFKSVNDRFSHAVGDEVLRRVAAIFREECRSSDCVARYGGEEFVVVMPETSSRQARSLAERIRRRVETYAWSEVHPDLSLTVSAGIATRQQAAHHEQLLRLADERMYAAKRAGKNRIRDSVPASIASGAAGA